MYKRGGKRTQTYYLECNDQEGKESENESISFPCTEASEQAVYLER